MKFKNFTHQQEQQKKKSQANAKSTSPVLKNEKYLFFGVKKEKKKEE